MVSTFNYTALQTAEGTDISALMLILRAGRGPLTCIRHSTHQTFIESFLIAIYRKSTLVQCSIENQCFDHERDFV